MIVKIKSLMDGKMDGNELLTHDAEKHFERPKTETPKQIDIFFNKRSLNYLIYLNNSLPCLSKL